MDQSPGLSFSPLNQNNPLGSSPYGGSPGPTSSPIQDAIKILSLRIPRAVGASGLAPMGLLNSPGSGGFPGGQSLESLLMRIFGQQPGMRVGSGPVASMPYGNNPGQPTLPQGPSAPRIIPGSGPAGQPAGPTPQGSPTAPQGMSGMGSPLTPRMPGMGGRV